VLENSYWIFPIIFLFSLTLSAVSVPLLKKLAFRFEIIDRPNQSHKTHLTPIPYLGGLAIVFPVLIVSASSVIFFESETSTIVKGSILIIPGLFLATVGLIDDKKNLSASSRLAIQVIVSSLISFILIQGSFGVKLSKSPTLDFIVSLIWIVGITNAFNFLDNLDGGASGVTTISSAMIFALSLLGSQYLIASFSLTICAASLGFLYWNRNPASIYLGDSGALFIGLILSVLLLQFEPSTSNKVSSIAIPLLLMAIPIIDTSVVVISRFTRGVSIFQGGRDHLSHRILSLGFSRRQAAYFIWTLGVFFAVIAAVIDQANFVSEVSLSIVGLITLFITIVIFLRIPQP
jgi:UDP-GlcNAc:undecaprenyl-phosphate GlcNAc-1-phosphate transferase